jgi:hypothetical protein
LADDEEAEEEEAEAAAGGRAGTLAERVFAVLEELEENLHESLTNLE